MNAARPKGSAETEKQPEPQIDPKLDKQESPKPGGSSSTPVSPTEQRRENQSDANRDRDGRRKRAEEGL